MMLIHLMAGKIEDAFFFAKLGKVGRIRGGDHYEIIEFLLLLIREKNSGAACTSCYNR